MLAKTTHPLASSPIPAEVIESLLRAATSAPSGDNLQPWRFSRRGEAIVIHHDSGRDTSLYNIHGFASFIALGAAIENLVIAASSFGYRAEVNLIPTEGSDVVAEINLPPETMVDPLVDFIQARCVNRRPYEARPLAAELVEALGSETKRFSGVKLHWIHEPGQRKILGNLVMQADRLLLENEHLHRQLFSCLRWTAEEVERTRDGLPVSTLELGKLGTKGFRALGSWRLVSFLNRLGLSRIAARHSYDLIRRSSHLGLITVPSLSPAGFVNAGRGFERLWLAVTSGAASLQPMTGFVFLQLRAALGVYDGLSPAQLDLLERLRTDLRAVFSLEASDLPVILFRIGYGPAPSGRTLRRSPEDVLIPGAQGLG